jgi:hypothetical protein
MTHEDAVRFGQALERSSALLITVPVDSTLEQGERAERGDNRFSRPATVAGLEPKTTPELAAAAGMSERTWQTRAKVGTRITPEVARILDPQVGPDDLLAFAELVAPYAYPDKPRIALEPKGVEA